MDISNINFENEKFFKVYKFLFEDDSFKNLSVDAKVIYSLIVERNSLSIKNNLKCKDGNYYIILKNKEIQSILNCGSQKAVKVLNELELVNLIVKKKQGLNKPNLIYLKSQFLTCENHNSKDVKITTQENGKSHLNKNNINKTDINNINISKTDIKSGALAPDNNGDMKITTQKQYSIPLKNGEYYNIYNDHIELYKSLYPNINVEQELRNIVGWNLANINKRKTLKGIKKHINLWLQKANSKALEKAISFNKINQNNKQENKYEPKYSTNDFFNS